MFEEQLLIGIICRKTNQNLVKDVCHIWELGGGTMYTNLIETPLRLNLHHYFHQEPHVHLLQPRQVDLNSSGVGG